MHVFKHSMGYGVNFWRGIKQGLNLSSFQLHVPVVVVVPCGLKYPCRLYHSTTLVSKKPHSVFLLVFFSYFELRTMRQTPALPASSEGSGTSRSSGHGHRFRHPLLRCACGDLAVILHASTPRNQGRWFIKCSKHVIDLHLMQSISFSYFLVFDDAFFRTMVVLFGSGTTSLRIMSTFGCLKLIWFIRT